MSNSAAQSTTSSGDAAQPGLPTPVAHARADDRTPTGFDKGVFPGSPALNELVADTGETWTAFHRTLTADYAVVWRDIGLRYVLVIGGVLVHAFASVRFGAAFGLVTAPLAAVWIGYWTNSLNSFTHEAAHYNIHPRKRSNDRLANLLLCPLVAEEMAHYRALHWEHHLNLGNPADTEVSYHQTPSLRFVLEGLTGVHTVRAIVRRGLGVRRAAPGPSSVPALPANALLRAAALHGAILAALFAAAGAGPTLAWLMGAGMIYPLCNGMRQLLEHRSPDAVFGVDYTQVPHGAVNRMFGSDLFSRTFGAAGFNRHLLHHWYPTASYTSFDALEAFMMRTPLAPEMDAVRTTYWSTLRQLWRA